MADNSYVGSRLRRSVLMTPIGEISVANVALLDLEDSLPKGGKLAASANAADAMRRLDRGGKKGVGRVNDAVEELGSRNTEATSDAGADVVLLTKVGDPAVVDSAAAKTNRLGSSAQIWRMIESAPSLLTLESIPAGPAMSGLCMGTGDLSLGLHIQTFGQTGLVGDGYSVASDVLEYARSKAIIAARARGSVAIDSAMCRLDIDDARKSYERSFRMGFDGKLILIPRQIPMMHDAYNPTHADGGVGTEPNRGIKRSGMKRSCFCDCRGGAYRSYISRIRAERSCARSQVVS